ncbi:MAG TPA: hypothetical protein VIK52_05680 [Opitutaceae bacterium]
MKTLSLVKLGAALCVSAMIVPVALAQAGGGDPRQNPSDPYSSPRQGAPGEPIEQAREREMIQEQQRTSVVDLASAKQMVNISTYDDRKRVLNMLDDSIDASHDEQKDLKRAARNLEGPTRDQLASAVSEAESKRDALNDSCKAFKRAKAEEWESRKLEVEAGIDQYAAALARARSIAMNSGRTAQEQPR